MAYYVLARQDEHKDNPQNYWRFLVMIPNDGINSQTFCIYSHDEIVDFILGKIEVRTMHIKDNIFQEGPLLGIERVGNKDLLRTRRNSIVEDNLSRLPILKTIY